MDSEEIIPIIDILKEAKRLNAGVEAQAKKGQANIKVKKDQRKFYHVTRVKKFIGQKIAEHKAHGLEAMQAALVDFKASLKKQCGPLFRGWRRLLDTDGSMSVQRADLFKVSRIPNIE